MNKRPKAAQIVVGLGCLILLVGAGLHMIAAYPMVSSALGVSNLSGEMKAAMRATFLLAGWTWAALGIVTLIAAFTETKIRKAIVVFCGLAILVQIPIWIWLMGWFIGNEMFTASATLIVIGGLMFPSGEKSSSHL